MFGAKEPGLVGVVCCDTGDSVLFIPRRSEESVMWRGPIKEPAWWCKHYAVTECYYVDQIEQVDISLLNMMLNS